MGPGTVVMSNSSPNTYTGPTVVNEGTLLLSTTNNSLAVPASLTIGDSLGGSGVNKVDIVRETGNNEIASSAVVTINSSGVFDLNNHLQTLSASPTALFMVGGSLTTGNGTLTLGGNLSGQQNPANETAATISGNLVLGMSNVTIDVQAATVPLGGADMVIGAAITGLSSGLTKVDNGTLQTDQQRHVRRSDHSQRRLPASGRHLDGQPGNGQRRWHCRQRRRRGGPFGHWDSRGGHRHRRRHRESRRPGHRELASSPPPR